MLLKLNNPRYVLLLETLNIGLKKISSHPCLILTFISDKLWEDPITKKLFLLGYNLCFKLRLNAGIYVPFKFNFQANLKLLASNSLKDLFLQYFLSFIISLILE